MIKIAHNKITNNLQIFFKESTQKKYLPQFNLFIIWFNINLHISINITSLKKHFYEKNDVINHNRDQNGCAANLFNFWPKSMHLVKKSKQHQFSNIFGSFYGEELRSWNKKIGASAHSNRYVEKQVICSLGLVTLCLLKIVTFMNAIHTYLRCSRGKKFGLTVLESHSNLHTVDTTQEPSFFAKQNSYLHKIY